MSHYFVRKEGTWFVNCTEHVKEFSVNIWKNKTVSHGICPYCGIDAELEIRERKKNKPKYFIPQTKVRRMCNGKAIKEEDLNSYLN